VGNKELEWRGGGGGLEGGVYLHLHIFGPDNISQEKKLFLVPLKKGNLS